jgi:hypothetical protein
MLLRQVIAASLTDGTSRVQLPLEGRIAARIPMFANVPRSVVCQWRIERLASPALQR